jgi:hypothetical protein
LQYGIHLPITALLTVAQCLPNASAIACPV